MKLPTATYRLQLDSGFTFLDAADLVPYLHALGISHCYTSPFLKARAGSPHGYDVVDHGSIDPELGGRDGFERFVAVLEEHGMGLVADLVPNHMGVGGGDNPWWLDLLENGPASRFADYFDVDWRPAKDALRAKVLVPLLGDHYGAILDGGELRLVFDAERGELSVFYHEHRFPLDPRTYGDVLAGADVRDPELASLLTAFEKLPARDDRSAAAIEERARDKEIHKRRLADLCRRSTAIRDGLERAVAAFNGVAGEPPTFDALHALLEKQAYRLAYWRVAADEINYRRFFDVNDLAGLRMEREEVFDATHRLILELVRSGRVHGLRIDHPDGLYDPAGYLRRLTEAVGEEPRVLIFVEKILAPYERLAEDWPVHGTTGYDFLNLVNGLFVDPEAEGALDRIYARFTGRRPDFEETLYACKKLVLRTQLSSELTVLSHLLSDVAESRRDTRDYTVNGLRDALAEVVACFPDYRTYVTAEGVSEQDRRFIDWAVGQAEKRSPAADAGIFDFIRRLLLLEHPEGCEGREKDARAHVAMKLQQLTAPVMAKGLEDTCHYVYNRLLAHNEVGGDPRRFAVSIERFHHVNQERARRHPDALLTTTTHDSKRSEDVRLRLDALSELTDEWRRRLRRWTRLNRRHKRLQGDALAPSRNDEYFLYQTLVGAWPLEELDDAGLELFRERVRAYMVKAVREAKVRTSWINPRPEYEDAVVHFLDHILRPGGRFLAELLPFVRRVARLGLLNGLSQTMLKLTVPGIPDFYQGCELWSFTLVDPDNRRPVDFDVRRRLLADIVETPDSGSLLDAVEDGRAKLHVIRRVLELRRERPELFARGEYVPLTVEGEQAHRVCAFARRLGEDVLVVAVPRLFAGIAPEEAVLPPAEAWGDTRVTLPEAGRYRDLLRGRPCEASDVVAASELFARFPVALLAIF